jgi:hypothetical protein
MSVIIRYNFDFDVPNKSTLDKAASRCDLFSVRTLINKIAAALSR